MRHPRMNRQLLKPKDAYYASVWTQLLAVFIAIKTAGINGLQVIFGYCEDVQSQSDIHKALKEHSV